ncbi:MAG: LacI family DNA-binding transcriptional regulator [Limnochordia bacterium]|nr:LacI family DNA-binding transcriptional regulator [Limnochordia bacterium]
MGQVLRKHVTIQDVAEYAGVSASTVSRAMRNLPGVHEETRRLVLEAANALKYDGPNWVARGLRTGESRVIAVQIESFCNSYYAELCEAIETLARKHGYLVVFSSMMQDLKDDLVALRYFLQSRVCGVIRTPIAGDERVRQLCLKMQQTGTTVVVLGDDLTIKDFHLVGLDTSFGVQQSIAYLYELGHRDIGFVSMRNITDRLTSYTKCIRQYGLTPRPFFIRSKPSLSVGAYQAALGLLDEPNRPSAVLCFNDLIAVQLIQAAMERGVQIPEELSVIGFDDTPEATLVQPQLTTVQVPKSQMGQRAVELVLKHASKETFAEQKERHIFTGKLKLRDSCASFGGSAHCQLRYS